MIAANDPHNIVLQELTLVGGGIANWNGSDLAANDLTIRGGSIEVDYGVMSICVLRSK